MTDTCGTLTLTANQFLLFFYIACELCECDMCRQCRENHAYDLKTLDHNVVLSCKKYKPTEEDYSRYPGIEKSFVNCLNTLSLPLVQNRNNKTRNMK